MHCFDREEECKKLWRHFNNNENILMLAPRRVGKTVLLNRLKEMASEQGFRAVSFDVEGVREEKDFFREFCSAIREEQGAGAKLLTAFSDRLGRLLKGKENPSSDWRQWLIETDWQEFADHLLAHLNDDKGGTAWIILVDELPIFVQALQAKGDGSAARTFLYWLRGVRQKYGNIRWIYAGSIGLDSVARRYNIEGALNDLTVFTLKTFDEKTARGFICDIAARRNCKVDEAALQEIVSRLGWLAPYYLKRIAEDSCELALDGHSASGALSEFVEISVSCKDADAALDNMLLLEKRNYWSSWREHLDRNFTEPDRGQLFALLESVAKSPDGAGRDVLISALAKHSPSTTETVLRNLLDVLLNDGYLELTDGRYRFQMHLLREWWLRHVVI